MFVVPAPLDIDCAQTDKIFKIVRDTAPIEACGVVRNGRIEQLPNIYDGDREHNFNMEGSLDGVTAFWHSHPNGPVTPSYLDFQCMAQSAYQGIVLPWIIATTGAIMAYIVQF